MTIPGSEMSRGPYNESGEIKRHRRIKAAAASGAIGLSTTGIALTQVPWWIAAMLILAALLCALVGRVFPQKSSDRLAWWRDRRHAQVRRRLQRGRTVRLPRQSGLTPRKNTHATRSESRPYPRSGPLPPGRRR
jgi:hypothetical protein